MTLLTISDYYRERYGRGIEVVCSLIIILSYLAGCRPRSPRWLFNLLSGGTISIPVGMVRGHRLHPAHTPSAACGRWPSPTSSR